MGFILLCFFFHFASQGDGKHDILFLFLFFIKTVQFFSYPPSIAEQPLYLCLLLKGNIFVTFLSPPSQITGYISDHHDCLRVVLIQLLVLGRDLVSCGNLNLRNLLGYQEFVSTPEIRGLLWRGRHVLNQPLID